MKISFLHICKLGFNPENKKINFIRNLSQISCPLLTTIEFRNNQIDSIEPFSRASVPSLKTLLIGRNYILYFRTFRKMNAPDFSNLDIGKKHHYKDHNYICDSQSLTQLNAAKSLSEIDLDWSQCREMSCDYRWMFKMQAQSLGNFCNNLLNSVIRSPKRIQQPKIKQKLNHKFLNIGIPHPN